MPEYNVMLSVSTTVEADDEIDALVQAKAMAVADMTIASAQASSMGAPPPAPIQAPPAVETQD